MTATYRLIDFAAGESRIVRECDNNWTASEFLSDSERRSILTNELLMIRWSLPRTLDPTADLPYMVQLHVEREETAR